MAKKSNDKDLVNLADKPYEENTIQLTGIVWTGVILFVVCVVSFVLMWMLQYWLLEPQAQQADKQGERPMAMTDKERLPPEPRLQSAPGFGVQSDKGTVNLELTAPAAEYIELRKQWEKQWAEGQKDPATGAMVTLPTEEAKKKLIEQGVKAKPAEEAQKAFDEANSIVSPASAGRKASEKRRY